MTTSLLELSAQVKSCDQSLARKVALFGLPGSGKTHLAATIARVPSIKKVHWFDLENGIETIIFAVDSKGEPLLTSEELAKIQVYRISDDKEKPRAAETLLKAFTSHSGVKLCQEHGIVNCSQCATTLVPFNLFTMDETEAIVIDSGSQLADSVIHLSQLLNPTLKHLKLHYGNFTNDMGAIVSGIQAARCHIIMCTHEQEITKEVQVSNTTTEEKILSIVPMCGSRNFSRKVGKYFGYKIYTYVNGASYRATCKIGKMDKVMVSYRRPVSFEGTADPSLEVLFASEEEAKKQEAVKETAKPKVGIPTISISK